MSAMNRRRLLQQLSAMPLFASLGSVLPSRGVAQARRSQTRARPNEPGWPDEASWEQLGRDVEGRLLKVQSPLAACAQAPASPHCEQVFKRLKNPYYLRDEVGLTQSLGWVDAWTSKPSLYALAAESEKDVVAGVNFARQHNLRLVVKGGGHSYQGTSNAADSLLIWARKLDRVTLHDRFVGVGCAGRIEPVPAVTVGAGAIWGQVYDAVTTRAGRYVQGGGCLTVGVAGLILSGGFGSFSKRYGLAAASLLEAEIVTADGTLRIVNPCTNPDLFWALKGGGGGSLGVVTRLTLRTHDLPELFGTTNMVVRAASDTAFRRLIGQLIRFYSEALFNPHWGEQISFRPGNVVVIAMLSQGLSQAQAETAWRPFLDWIAASPQEYTLISPPTILSVPARQFWDPEVLGKVPGLVVSDDRTGSPASNIFYANNVGEAGQVLHGYQSAWLPAMLLRPEHQDRLADALFAASRHWSVTLHMNKGLAGASAEAIAGARDTATNPLVLEAFALLISAAQGPPAYPGIAGREPDLPAARRHAGAIGKAMAEIERVVPVRGAYVAESDFFDADWRQSYWGANYPRLLAVKDKYDPDGLFIVHHGVGSERWSPDGFTRLSSP
jgi:FAD/FMN-containing dehydrogenase